VALASLTLVSGAQTTTGEGGANSDTQAPPAVAPDTADDMVLAFRTNAALVDQKYKNKRVIVSGRFRSVFGGVRFESGDPGTFADYFVEMQPEQQKFKNKTCLHFRFTGKDWKALASLQVGEWLTIEALCQGIEGAKFATDWQAINFYDCKIVKVGK
jgi:hypothetical protein